MSETKHERVSRLLREGLGQPGSTIPSEAELVRHYDVSRATIRQALATLEAEGLIMSSQGSRRTVRDSTRWRWDMSSWEKAHNADADAWANTIKTQGGTPYNDISVHVVQATEDVAAALHITARDRIYTRSRVRSVNGEPHQLSDSFFPGWLTDEDPGLITPGDVAAKGGLLAAGGHPQARFFDTLSARMPTAEESTKLRMTTGTPLLVHTRVGYDKDNRPLRYMITRMAADKVQITYDVDA
ncbi:MAG: GntR family transcriptional regulator [Nocardioidaceae bacterium]